MTEAEMLGSVLDLCQHLHIHTAHFRPARTLSGWRTAVSGDGKGFPDLVMVGSRGVLYRELKTAKGVLSHEQKVWIERLKAAGQNAGIWRPEDLRSGWVVHELQAVR